MKNKKNYISKILLLVAIGLMPLIYSCKSDTTNPNQEEINLVSYWCDNGKYGLVDKKTGNQIVPCIYDRIYDFSEGLAVVRIGYSWDGKYGFIDKTGKEVTPLKYDAAYPFSQGLALVMLRYYDDAKYGFIDKTGKEVIPLIYDQIYLIDDYIFFSESGKAKVLLGNEWFCINKKNEKVDCD